MAASSVPPPPSGPPADHIAPCSPSHARQASAHHKRTARPPERPACADSAGRAWVRRWSSTRPVAPPSPASRPMPSAAPPPPPPRCPNRQRRTRPYPRWQLRGSGERCGGRPTRQSVARASPSRRRRGCLAQAHPAPPGTPLSIGIPCARLPSPRGQSTYPAGSQRRQAPSARSVGAGWRCTTCRGLARTFRTMHDCGNRSSHPERGGAPPSR